MKPLKEKNILQRLYEAVCYFNNQNGVERIRSKQNDEILKSLKVRIAAKKKLNRKIEKRILRKMKKIEKIRKYK